MSGAEDHTTVTGEISFYDENRVRLDEDESLAELQQDIMRASFQNGAVTLESGVEQPYFFEKYLIVAKPTILRRLAHFLALRLPAGTDRIAAPTLGAVAIGTAVSLDSGLPLAIVRSESGENSRGRPIEGGLHTGEVVVLIEDVVVTGQRALRAVVKLRDAGVEVGMVISVVDCDRGADVRFSAAGLEYGPLFRSSLLLPGGLS
jgi:orotate phosphoribosyltransferase